MSQSGGNEGLGFAIPSATATNGVPPAPAIRSPAPAGSRHEHPDHHAGHGGVARTVERLAASSCRTCGPAVRPQAAGLAVGDILVSVDGQARREPADGQLQLPAEGFAEQRPTGRAPGRGADQHQRQAGGSSAANSIRCRRCPIRRRTWWPSSASSAWRSTHALPRPPPGLQGSVRHHRRRARGQARPATCRSRPRDVIRSVNNRRVATLDGLRESVRSLAPGTPVTHADSTRRQADVRLVHVRIAARACAHRPGLAGAFPKSNRKRPYPMPAATPDRPI